MKKLFILLFAFSVSTGLLGQKSKAASSVIADNKKESLLDNLNYRLIGPFRGGRSAAVAGSYQKKNTFYFGATGGGVWKTTDAGNNWTSISDKFFGSSIGSVAVAPGDETISL